MKKFLLILGALSLLTAGTAIYTIHFKPVRNEAIAATPLPNGVVIPVLMYHHVGDLPQQADAITDDLTVPASSFEEQVAWLAKQGYHSMTLAELYDYSQGKFELPKKPIIFTFDDGYSDAFENAVPILVKHHFTGSFGIITQWPGTTVGTNTYATWQQIAQAKQQGMDIVSHTQIHFDGTSRKYDYQFIASDLKNSRQDIADHLGSSTNVLIYPYGHYNNSYIKIAQAAGFKIGVTEHFSAAIDLQNLMEVPRLRVHGQEPLNKFQEILFKYTEKPVGPKKPRLN